MQSLVGWLDWIDLGSHHWWSTVGLDGIAGGVLGGIVTAITVAWTISRQAKTSDEANALLVAGEIVTPTVGLVFDMGHQSAGYDRPDDLLPRLAEIVGKCVTLGARTRRRWPTTSSALDARASALFDVVRDGEHSKNDVVLVVLVSQLNSLQEWISQWMANPQAEEARLKTIERTASKATM